MANLVPCPNGGKCGYMQHVANSHAFQDCLFAATLGINSYDGKSYHDGNSESLHPRKGEVQSREDALADAFGDAGASRFLDKREVDDKLEVRLKASDQPIYGYQDDAFTEALLSTNVEAMSDRLTDIDPDREYWSTTTGYYANGGVGYEGVELKIESDAAKRNDVERQLADEVAALAAQLSEYPTLDEDALYNAEYDIAYSRIEEETKNWEPPADDPGHRFVDRLYESDEAGFDSKSPSEYSSYSAIESYRELAQKWGYTI